MLSRTLALSAVAAVCAGARWPPRYGLSAVKLENGAIVVAGGQLNETFAYGDVWRSTDGAGSWTLVEANAEWGARTLHTSVAVNNDMYIFGGQAGNEDDKFNDVWVSGNAGVADPGAVAWSLVANHSAWSPRSRHVTVVVQSTDFLLFGGCGGDGCYNDVWRSRDLGLSWARVAQSAEWSRENFPTGVVLASGRVLMVEHADTSESNAVDRAFVWASDNHGANWTRIRTINTNVQAENEWYSLVTLRDSVLLLGTYPDSNWESSDEGASWVDDVSTQRGTAYSAYFSSLQYDDFTVLLLGGMDEDGLARTDVWRSCKPGQRAQPAGGDEYEMIVCSDCGAGSYSTSRWQTVCTPCDPGTASSATAATTSGVCQFCAAGYMSEGAAATCTTCAEGKYSSMTGSAMCDLCDAGTYNPVRAGNSSAVCRACPVGTYGTERGARVCQSCAAGKASRATRATSAATCTDCPAGSFTSATGASACAPCPVGAFSSVNASTSCTLCPAGTFASQAGSAACTPCAPDTYSDKTGSSSCTPCGARATSAAGSSKCKTRSGFPVGAIVATVFVALTGAGVIVWKKFCRAQPRRLQPDPAESYIPLS